MTILLYNDGKLVVDNGNPLEGVSLDGLLACISDPQEGDSLIYNGSMWVPGNPFPVEITEPEDGDTLVYDSGKWVNVHAEAAGGGE